MLVVGYRSYCTILSGESSTFQHVCMPTGVSDTRRNNWIPILSRRPSCECLVHVSMHRSMGEAVIVWDDRKDFVMDLGRLRTWFVITIAVSLAHKRLGVGIQASLSFSDSSCCSTLFQASNIRHCTPVRQVSQPSDYTLKYCRWGTIKV